jgi:hypothetical protein
MVNKNKKNFILGIVLLLFPIYSFLALIYVFGNKPYHPARVEKYKEFFLGIFQGPLLHGVANLACAALAIVFLARLHKLSTPAAILKYALIVISSLLIMFNLWTLM